MIEDFYRIKQNDCGAKWEWYPKMGYFFRGNILVDNIPIRTRIYQSNRTIICINNIISGTVY